jgi:hypothetical protein
MKKIFACMCVSRRSRPDPAAGTRVGSLSNRELVVLGTASQAPTRTRNHNGYFLRWDDEGLLFDPGEGTQRQMLFAGVTAHQVTRDTLSLRERPVPEAGAVLADGPAFRLEARPLSHRVPAVGYRLRVGVPPRRDAR